MIEDGTNGKSSNVGADGGDGEHEVQPDLDARVMRIVDKGICIAVEALVVSIVAELANVGICALELENGLDRSVAKD
jgi:hypothetical protein